MRSEWKKLCTQTDILRSSKVCETHFSASSYRKLKSGILRKYLKSDAIPTILRAAQVLPLAPPQSPVLPQPLVPPQSPGLPQPPAVKSIQCTRLKDFRPQLLNAKKKIFQLEAELRKSKQITGIKEKLTVKKFLMRMGHTKTFVKHILTPKHTHRRNYSEDDVSLGLVLKNLSNKEKHKKNSC